MRPRRAAAALTLALGPLMTTGCAQLLTHQTGVRIGDTTLAQFEAGVTTKGWLIAVLGQPTARARVEGIPNTEVYRYALGERSSGISAILYGTQTKNTAVVYFIITDDVVTRFWADREVEQPLLLGKPRETTGGEKQ